MEEKKYCPCCGRHCDLSEPHCGRGEEYAKTGKVVEHEHDKHKQGNAFRTANYKEMDTDNKLIMNLRDLGHMLRFLFEGKGSQKRILIILNETGGMTQRELTERIGVQPGSASEVIGKLESAGLIKRSPSETDRRTTDVKLTEAGRLQAEEAGERRKTRHQEMFSCLSQEEKETLLELMEKLSEHWEHRYHDKNMKHGHCGMQGREHGHHNMNEKSHEPYGHHGPHGEFHR